MKHIPSFKKFTNESKRGIMDYSKSKTWLKEAQRHKPVDHIENIEIKSESDEEADEKIQKYVDDNIDYCPRCGEHTSDCQCKGGDPWSTQNYHRVPKGSVE